MSWASRQTAEMPTLRPGSGGRHRRRTATSVGVVASAALLVLLVVGAMFAPTWLGWPPPADRVGAHPSTVAARDGGSATATPTQPPSTQPASPRPTASPSRARTPAQPAPMATGVESLESAVLSLTNAQRAEHGCPKLRLDAMLRSVARLHSADMARYGYFDHTGRDGREPDRRLRDAGYPTDSGWAENIARGYGSPPAVMAGWMASPGHRANILNCGLGAIGVGVARSRTGHLYWTQDFGGR